MKRTNGNGKPLSDGVRQSTSSEVRNEIQCLEAAGRKLRDDLDSEEVTRGSEIDDPDRYRRSIDKCTAISAEIDRHGRLLQRAKLQLTKPNQVNAKPSPPNVE